MTKRWHLASILRGEELESLFAETVWKEEAERTQRGISEAVQNQDRRFLDFLVPDEMLVYGAGAAGLLVYRADNGYLRTRHDYPGEPVSLAWVLAEYGSSFAEDLLEAGVALEPSLE